MQRLLAAIQVLDKFRDAAVVLELSRLGVAGLRVSRALIGQRDEQALIQEGQLAKPLRQRVEVVLGDSEDFFIGQELNFGPTLLGGAGLLELAGRLALRICLLPGETVTPDFEIKLMAQSVHARHAHTMQSARNLVGRSIKLAAGVQLGHDHLRRRHFFAIDFHVVDRNAATVIDYSD